MLNKIKLELFRLIFYTNFFIELDIDINRKFGKCRQKVTKLLLLKVSQTFLFIFFWEGGGEFLPQ